MKKINHKFLKQYNALLGVILSLLGFSTACEMSADEYGTMHVEYGVPHATFIVKGNVATEETDKPISNIQVVMNYDTSFTNSEGKYEIATIEFPTDQTFNLEFKDVDGAENEKFQSLDTLVKFIDPQFENGKGNWDSGEVEKTLDIQLKSKK